MPWKCCILITKNRKTILTPSSPPFFLINGKQLEEE
jgi:hypothetical protein